MNNLNSLTWGMLIIYNNRLVMCGGHYDWYSGSKQINKVPIVLKHNNPI